MRRKHTPESIERKFKKFAAELPRAAAAEMKSATRLVKRQAQQRHLSGPRMAVGMGSQANPTIDSKGSLRNSLRTHVRRRGGTIVAQVEARHGLANILHNGGTQVAKRGKTFVFEVLGRRVVTDRVRMPARPFLRAAHRKKRREIAKGMLAAMKRRYVRT